MKLSKLQLLLIIVIVFMSSFVIATKWSDYTDQTAGNIADVDTFLIRDVDDTTLAATGTQKEYPWSVMKTDLTTWLNATSYTSLTGNWHTTGTALGKVVVTTATSERVLTTAELGGGIVRVTFAGEVRLPDLCDSSATGAAVMIVQGDPSETVEIAVTDTSDHVWLDGTDLGANFEIDSPGDAVSDNYIVMVCEAADNWHSKGRSGTWVTGGAAD